MQSRLVELQRYLQVWVSYFRFVPLKSFYDDLERWIRRSVRPVAGGNGVVLELVFVT